MKEEFIDMSHACLDIPGILVAKRVVRHVACYRLGLQTKRCVVALQNGEV